jgi:hypothetical protein
MQTPAHATHNRASSTLLGNAAPELDLHQEEAVSSPTLTTLTE